MIRLLLCLVLSLLSACGGFAADEQLQSPSVATSVQAPLAFPDQEQAPLRGSWEEMMKRHADVLKVTPDGIVVLQTQNREVDIHLDEKERDLFVVRLLHSLQQYDGDGEFSGLTLQDIRPVTLPDTEQGILEVSLSKLASAYRDLLEISSDPAIRLQGLHRLADVILLQGELDLSTADAGNSEAYLAQSIQAYEALLRDNPDYPANDQLLYQLAKAYALRAENDESLVALHRLTSDYPESSYVPEAEFRIAENYFSLPDYRRAELAYTRVLGFGKNTPYYMKALYMQGWSRLEMGEYQSAIEPLVVTLDYSMSQGNDMALMARGDRELAQDSLRALALIFIQLDGAQSINQSFAQLGARSYQPLVFLQLAELYKARGRHVDSAETYKSYLGRFPDSKDAFQVQRRVIESYEAAGFSDLVAQEKQHYLERFVPGGYYWQGIAPTLQVENGLYVKRLMQELATYHHALAQREAEFDAEPATVSEHYKAAITYYQLFLDSFPEDGQAPELGFLLGECRFEVDDFSGAIAAYERVAYGFGGAERAADAAYAAILAYERIGPEAGSPTDLRRISSERKFAVTFSTDPRALPVLGHASSALLQLNDFAQSAELASIVIGWQPAPDQDVLTAALLVLGHSFFAMQQYGDAEQAYLNAHSALPAEDERYLDTVNRLAASIYRQGELAVGAGEYLAAARQFERVISAAPLSPIRINAQFDAAMNYVLAAEFEQANTLLHDFRERFHDQALAASVGPQLVSNYEELGQWQAAALELDRIADAQPPGERERQALYLSASYYDKVGAVEPAIQRYKSYIDLWPTYFATKVESMNRLGELYSETGQSEKRYFWLAKIISTHDRAGSEQTERSLYLAADSASVLADSEYTSFSAIKLRYPIKVSLGRKRTAMERAVAAYQKTEAYGIEQFSTLATYRIGRIYQQLAIDLISSDRPVKLDAMALEQYELLLEEQAYPFEEKAIAIYETNSRRSWDGLYNEWIRKSFIALGELMPARYRKLEKGIGFSGEIY